MPFHSPNSLVYILATSGSCLASYLQSIAQLQAPNLQRENESFCHKPLSLNRGYLFQSSSVCRALQKLVFSCLICSFAFTFTTFEYFYRLDDDRVEGRLGKSIQFMSCTQILSFLSVFLFSRCNQIKFAFVLCHQMKSHRNNIFN